MNRLARAASPYLLQHRDNPVHWWEWSDAAFADARARGRPVLLSVGYAACHWCHVMAHESFEDEATAAVMNELFVNIKVDREERPDIDQVYMSALHSLGEQGGWPLTMFLDGRGRPFWGGTYFPKDARFGRPAFTTVLRQIAAVHASDPDRIARNAEAIGQALAAVPKPPAGPLEADLDAIGHSVASAFDPVHGGLRGAPKFPNPALIELLWRHAGRTGDAGARAAATTTLDRMARGGLHDHLGGGFARYSVDERWLVPHFEKMLYDNAQLLPLYALEAARTGDPLMREAAQGIVAWLRRDMLLVEGAFAASLDADSEGEEGTAYLWTDAQVEDALGREDAALFARHYDVRPEGNWEGRCILNRLAAPDPDAAAAARLAILRETLLTIRRERPQPARDDKILADWNGLAIAGLARAAGLLGRPDWLGLARDAYRFVASAMADGHGLAHAIRGDRLITPGFALDHAAMIDAALALHAASPDPALLADAVRWSDHLMRDHHDDATGLLRMTRADIAELPAIPRPTHDDAIPNAIGVQAANLVRLAVATGRAPDTETSERFLKAALGAAARAPTAHAAILNALDLAQNGIEIVLAGREREELREAALRLPHLVVTPRDCPDASRLEASHPARAMIAQAGKGAAFICGRGRCLPPVTRPEDVRAAFEAFR